MATIIPSVCTEQQALTYSQQYPNLVFYASDTGKIISNGGEVYGKESISSPLVRVDEDVTVSLSALSDEMFDNTLTQSAAITASSTNTDVIYLATDTKAIIKAGVIYGGSVDVAKPFKFAPDLTDQSNWDTNYIYVVPSSTNILLYAYVSGAWANVSTQTITLETDASDINYDLTNTPNLGSGDVQSAIEAEDAKVEQLSFDTIGKDESGEYWEDLLFEKYGYSAISANNRRIGANHTATTDGSGVSRKVYIFPASEGDVFKWASAAGSGDWTGFWKGGTAYANILADNYLSSTTLESGTATAPAEATCFAYVTTDARINNNTAHVWKKTTRPVKTPADIQRQLIEGWTLSSITNSGVIGSKLSYFVAATGTYAKRIEVKKGQVLLLDLSHSSNYPLTFTDYDRVITELHPSPVYGAFEAPNNGYAYLLNGGDIPDNCYIYIMGYGGHAKDMDELQKQFDALYRKGVADGAGMASIAGLGYNVYDYISGAINLEGFEYGCKLYKESQSLSGACADRYKNNTSLVYFPKFDMSAVTTWGSIFNGCTKLQVVPDLNASSPTGSYQFSGCTNLLEVGDIGSESGTISAYYMFQNCTHLRRVGNIHAKISGSTGRMFYITSALTHIESINFSLQTTVYTNTGNQTFTSTSVLRYVVLKYIGTPSDCTALNLSLITNWGVASIAEPDARQSLIDTLITYSFDRATAGYSACTITLSANTKALLTTEELEQITAKGYTIA